MKPQRLLSLDAFRGFTVASMLLVNNPGEWAHIYGPLEHAEWNGWAFTDWIFPFFVFISGISMTLSLGRRVGPKGSLMLQTWRRGLTIIAIGLLLNSIGHSSFDTIRIPGVLQRIGLCTILTVPLVLWCSVRGQVIALIALLAVYSLIQLGVPVPDAQGVVHTGSLAAGQDVGAWIDRALLNGHLWFSSKTWDPEGLLSTLPAVASQLAGVLAGQWLAAKRDATEKAMGFMIAGLLLLWAAQVGDAWLMPINKSLWTPPYMLLCAGWACLIFGSFYWLLDAMPRPLLRERLARWAFPFTVFGMNALFMFALSGLVGRLLVLIKDGQGLTLKGMIYAPIKALPLEAINTSLVYAIGFVAVMYLAAWIMFKKRWFFKV
ncbi:MAG TPA: heparan-alpha-glucosaminide N-acetyltransferase domain-containing protein [Burkholderiaceae bacterium]|jgi:predicted acyltransferase